MKEFIHELITQHKVKSQNIVYINFELDAFETITTKKELKELIETYYQQIKPKGQVYLLLDEIQNVVGWEKYINSLQADDTMDVNIFLT